MPHVPPPLVALAAGAAQRALTGSTPRPGPVRATAAIGVALVAGWLAGSASRQFQRRGTTVQPFHPEQASVLVTDGANAVTRNPMYVGMAGLLVAHAIWRGSWPALGPAAGFVVVVDRIQVRPEEAALRERCGPSYTAYLEAVPRWLDARSLPRSAG